MGNIRVEIAKLNSLTMCKTLVTARLQLRSCKIHDLQAIHLLWTDPHIRHFLFDNRVISLDETRSFVELSLETFKQYGYGIWLVLLHNQINPDQINLEHNPDQYIGFAGFLRSEVGDPGLVYGIHPDFCGQGYATEAARAVLDYALRELGFSNIKADVDEPNMASRRVLEKLGMKQLKRAVVNGQPLLYFEYCA